MVDKDEERDIFLSLGTEYIRVECISSCPPHHLLTLHRHLLPVPFLVIVQSSASLIPREGVSLSCGRHSASDKRIYQTPVLASLSLTPLILVSHSRSLRSQCVPLLTLSPLFSLFPLFSSSLSCDRSSVAVRIIACHHHHLPLSPSEDDVLGDLSKSHSLFLEDGFSFSNLCISFTLTTLFQFSSPLSSG